MGCCCSTHALDRATGASICTAVCAGAAHGIIGQIHALASITEQVHEDLRNIAVETLVIVGSQDILTPVADSEEIAHSIDGARLQVISGAAHGAVVTDATVFNRAIESFLREQVGARAIWKPAPPARCTAPR